VLLIPNVDRSPPARGKPFNLRCQYWHSPSLDYISCCVADHIMTLVLSYSTATHSSNLEMIPYENGDVEIRIQHFRFLVSSSIMSQTSPEFCRLFTNQKGSLRECIELPDEDPLVFHLICQLVHGSFIPQAQISLQTLVKMADVIQQYKIPATTRVYNTVAYSYLVQNATARNVFFVQAPKSFSHCEGFRLLQIRPIDPRRVSPPSASV
jgi:BTB/POZ domain